MLPARFPFRALRGICRVVDLGGQARADPARQTATGCRVARPIGAAMLMRDHPQDGNTVDV
jgi:hypothetical protein